jgi:hypothetical protein
MKSSNPIQFICNYLGVKMNRFTQKCSPIRTTSSSKTRKDAEIKFYKGDAVLVLTYGSEIWTIKKKQEVKIETAGMKFLRSVAGYIVAARSNA